MPATNFWIGGAASANKMKLSSTIVSYDVNTAYAVTQGAAVISTPGTGGTANTTAVALVGLLNASTHPYISRITWTAPGAGVVMGECDTTGEHFEAVLSATGGTGTVTDFTEVTHAENAYDAATPANWSLGIVPIAGHAVVIGNTDVPIYWGLKKLAAITLDSLRISLSLLADLGLNSQSFATAIDTTSSNEAYPEYRTCYLTIAGATNGVYIGENFGPANINGTDRLMLSIGATTKTIVTVYDTGNATEDGKPAIRLLFNKTDHELYVRRAPAGVGVAMDKPGETSSLGLISVSDTSQSSRVLTGPGVTFNASMKQTGGNNVIQSAAAIPLIEVDGGNFQAEGEWTATALKVKSGTAVMNNTKAGGNAITTADVSGSGTLDGQGSTQARTWATVNGTRGGTVKINPSVTITTPNWPDGAVIAA